MAAYVTNNVFSSISNAVNSPLLRLPAEIRNEIFAYVYTGTVYALKGLGYPARWVRTVLENFKGSYGMDKEVSRSLLSLSFVCCQVHAETAILPYELGTSDFRAADMFEHQAVLALKSFLEERSPRQLHAIKKMRLWHLSRASDYSYPHNRTVEHWEQTRTAAFWAAMLEEHVFADAAELVFGETHDFKISSIGPSDSEAGCCGLGSRLLYKSSIVPSHIDSCTFSVFAMIQMPSMSFIFLLLVIFVWTPEAEVTVPSTTSFFSSVWAFGGVLTAVVSSVLLPCFKGFVTVCSDITKSGSCDNSAPTTAGSNWKSPSP